MPSAVAGALEPGPPALDLLTGPEKPDDAFAIFDDDDLSLLAALSLLEASEIGRLNAENRFQIFALPGEIPPQVKRVWAQKIDAKNKVKGFWPSLFWSDGLRMWWRGGWEG